MVPKLPTLVAAATPARTVGPKPAPAAHPPDRLTATVEMAKDRNDRAQNGRTSAASDRRPDRPHTHRRFNSNEGAVPTAEAITLAQPGDSVAVATREASTTRLTVVEMTDTPA